MAGALTLAGDLSGAAVCEATTPDDRDSRDGDPRRRMAAMVLRIAPTCKSLPGFRAISEL